MAIHPASAQTPSAPTPPAPWRERTLSRLVTHVRAVMPVSAVAFVTAGSDELDAEQPIGWFADEDLRVAIEASLSRMVRTRSMLLPRVDAWQAAPDLMEAISAELGEARAQRVWDAYRGASVIVCPVRGEIGRPLGALVVASLDETRPLGRAELPTVEALADLAAMALERTSLLETEGRRAREELRLKRASEAVSASLDPSEVYTRVVEHAAAITGGTHALLTRLNARAGELRTAAHVNFSDELAAQLVSLDRGNFREVARARRPVLHSGADAAPLVS
ncbi:MAG TPA: GAF domain-containing protein, partial [Thermoleophilaceae bacterium]|nr:GAF domain-containing protein [Thermoleophilaceae bacterium]